jgi:hypothetical protein
MADEFNTNYLDNINQELYMIITNINKIYKGIAKVSTNTFDISIYVFIDYCHIGDIEVDKFKSIVKKVDKECVKLVKLLNKHKIPYFSSFPRLHIIEGTINNEEFKYIDSFRAGCSISVKHIKDKYGK